MTKESKLFNDFHWLMDILQSIDVGLVVFDHEYKISLWNRFMQNHSALMPNEALERSLFELFPELPRQWFEQKVQSVNVLKNTAFTTWEQRPYIFKFPSYRPITGTAKWMYQNSTIMPLINIRGQVEKYCLIIYDVTDTAVNKMELETANRQLETLSRTDPLTGLFNRGYWEECLERSFNSFRRYQKSCSLLMFDIDHFKQVNDNYGHPMGDEVIRQTAALLNNELRDTDISGRYGGEEYVVILTETDINGAKIIAERIRDKVESMAIEYQGKKINYTISLGVAAAKANIKTTQEWINQADKALYQAKHNGRNCWSVYNNSN